jgi:DNA-binding MurR/RpiR family transcriptional regulator
MLSIDISRLNPYEKSLYEQIKQAACEEGMTITRAAALCGCSASKISKLVHRLGFSGYKQFISVISGKEITRPDPSPELRRIAGFLDSFDDSLADQIIDAINRHDQIVLFGYGPSYYCLQYFEYKLRFATNKTIIASDDELIIRSSIDRRSLLLIFSVTGNFKSFVSICRAAKNGNCETILIMEEYRPAMLQDYDSNKVLFLTKSCQSDALKPYEKSRTVFFILIEEILRKIIASSKNEKNIQDRQSPFHR